jgi:hypothetical protein
VRDHADEGALRVVVLSTLGAPERRLLPGRRRWRSAAAEPPPTPVPTSRATVIRGEPAADEESARAWMRDPQRHTVEELVVLNRVLHLHRVAAADHAVREVGLGHALAVRVGFGSGEEVAYGRWADALEPPRAVEGAVRRPTALRPHERLGALLAGKDAALACEELALRARADIDAGRAREAALQLRVALEAAIAELEAWTGRGDLADRLGELRDQRGAVGEAANAALRGGLDAATRAAVEHALGRVEAALRARTAGGVG